jgi:hypothetical protein
MAAALLGAGTIVLAADEWNGQASSDPNSSLALYRDAGGRLGIPTMFLTGTPSERSVGVGDANHDGHADLAVWHADTDTLWILHGDGAGGFRAPRIVPAGSRQKVVAFADFNKDGIDDQAVEEPFARSARLRFSDDTGKFRLDGIGATSSPGAVLVADLNRDGRIDLVKIDGTASHVAVFLGTEDDSFGAETQVPLSLVPSVMATGDFNGDGILDIVVGDRNGESVSVLVGDLRGGFTVMREIEVGLRPVSLAVGDLTGDGIADVVAAGRGIERVVILSGDGAGGFGAPKIIRAASSLGANEKAVSDAGQIGRASSQSSEVYEGVVALTLNPSTVSGGTGGTSTGTVTLNAPAPAGGVVVTLASSNVELAATMPSVTVPAGATQATFTVTTNSFYRRFSGLGFSVTISATHAATVSATLNTTAQARPAAFNSGVAAGDQTQWAGLMCSNIPPMGFEGGILFQCTLPPAVQGQWGSCTFRQECRIGCRRVPAPDGVNFNDFCATTGPNPIAVSTNYIVSGDRVPASLILEAPAPPGGTFSGFVSASTVNGNASAFPNASQPADPFFPFPNLAYPTGASTAVFDVATSYVPSTNFVLVNGEWHPPGSSGNFFVINEGRSGHAWIAARPPNPPPSTPTPILGDFRIVGANPVTGGQSSIAQFHLSGITPGAGPTITVTSSHPAIVAPMTVVAPTTVNLFGFDASIATSAPASDTDVTLTASDGRYSFSRTLRVLVPPPPPLLAGVSVNPSSVVGGNSATGTVTLSRTQNGPTVVQVSIIDTAPATLPANNPPCPPSSRCYNVTVPAGATSASFTIATSPVTFQFNLNIQADLPGSPGQSALLLITTGGPPRLRSLTHSPDSVIGGNSATGTVTLTTSAPSGGSVIQLSDNSTAVTVPANVTVPAGQTSATFAITTSAVTSDTSVGISATFAGETFNDAIFVMTVLRTVDLNPSTVVGGTPSTGSVILGTPAPAGGAIVTLSSSNTTLVTVPASVTVPAGATSASFTASTTAVTSFSFADISASYRGATVSSRLFLSTAANTVSALTLNPTSVVGPNSVTATVTLGGAVTSCCPVVELASSDPPLAQVPASISFSTGQTSATFTVNTGSVIAARSVTISASLNGTTRSAVLTVNPPGAPAPVTLSALSLSPTSVAGGNASTGTVTLSGAAPAGGAAVTLSSNNAAATVPGSVTVAAGSTSATFAVSTSAVTANTTVTITGTLGVTQSASLTVTPPPAPAAPTLVSPANAATVAQPVTLDWNDVANATSYEAQVDNTSTISAPFVANPTVTVSQATLSGLPAQQLWWRVRARNSAGVFGPFSATRQFTPQGAPAPASLSLVTVNPSSVVGPASATGTVTLTSAAPSGGAVVTLTSNNAAAAVPANVTVAAGATTATFTVTTVSVSAATAATITAAYNGVTRTATVTVNPASASATLTVTATGRSGERVTSSPTGINVLVGSTGSASFAVNTSITLSVTNGRDAIWSGACSSGGNKQKTCTFTITGTASVTANVQ